MFEAEFGDNPTLTNCDLGVTLDVVPKPRFHKPLFINTDEINKQMGMGTDKWMVSE